MASAIWVLSFLAIPAAVLIHGALTQPSTAVENAAETLEDDDQPVDTSTAPAPPVEHRVPAVVDRGPVGAGAVHADVEEPEQPSSPLEPSPTEALSTSATATAQPSDSAESAPSATVSPRGTTPPAPAATTSVTKSAPNSAPITSTAPQSTTPASTTTSTRPAAEDADAAVDCAECATAGARSVGAVRSNG